jgi:cation diffusion facilitator family transporter
MVESANTVVRHAADREKQFVAASSVAAAVLLTLLKLIVGLSTHSLGILAEAAHSGLDLVAAMITLWAVRVSSKPADLHHTYGHGKFENLSAFIETLLLLITCVWIIYEACHRLFFAAELTIDANLWAFLVIVVSIVVDFSRSRALHRAAVKHRSQALEADALHFSTDIWSSCVVFFGLIGVVLAKRLDMPWLVHADAVASLGVAAIVIGVSVQLGKKSLADLLDSVPADLPQELGAAARGVPGVEEVLQVRVRRSGPEVFADVTLAVRSAASFEGSHAVADRAEAAIQAIVPGADVVIHTEPLPLDDEDLLTKIRTIAARHALGAHGIRIVRQQHRRALELHLEVPDFLSVEEAHRHATDFETSLRAQAPEISRIVTHLEPTGDASATLQVESVSEAAVRQAIHDFVAANPIHARPHEYRVHSAEGQLMVSFHCTLDADIPITAAHEWTEQLERYLRQRIPRLGRVVIHVEPHRAE